MTTIAVVSPSDELSDRVDWWLSRDHHVTRGFDPTTPVTVFVLNRHQRHDRALLQAMRQASPRGWVVVTGDADQPPTWVSRLASRDRHVVAVFPAAPAALQVTVRSLLNRDTPSSA